MTNHYLFSALCFVLAGWFLRGAVDALIDYLLGHPR